MGPEKEGVLVGAAFVALLEEVWFPRHLTRLRRWTMSLMEGLDRKVQFQ